DLRAAVAAARLANGAVIRESAAWPGRLAILAAPGADSGIAVVVVAPKSRLYPAYPFAQLYGIDLAAPAEPPYTLRLLSFQPDSVRRENFTWWRSGSELHGDWVASTGTGLRAAHVEVDLRSVPILVQ